MPQVKVNSAPMLFSAVLSIQVYQREFSNWKLAYPCRVHREGRQSSCQPTSQGTVVSMMWRKLKRFGMVPRFSWLKEKLSECIRWHSALLHQIWLHVEMSSWSMHDADGIGSLFLTCSRTGAFKFNHES